MVGCALVAALWFGAVAAALRGLLPPMAFEGRFRDSGTGYRAAGRWVLSAVVLAFIVSAAASWWVWRLTTPSS
jgi:hypothetical protein